ncbi:MAG TPA: hypothetical protein PLN63_04685 [Paludibacteraceae bacterium]|nr:hypothetical protein [Paludibacteraceae bacterium]HPH62897.1 hypothetical protein [Paludibacteraceae bacterium]
MEQAITNEAKKQYYCPNHTAEHLLNQTMIRMFNCGRAVNAHIEEKKSKCDYALPQEPSAEDIAEIEKKMNDVIAQNLSVTSEYMDKEEAKVKYNLSRLPEDATDTLKIVHIGNYDSCPCIGAHVENTSKVGTFKILSSSYADGIWRVRWKTSRD